MHGATGPNIEERIEFCMGLGIYFRETPSSAPPPHPPSPYNPHSSVSAGRVEGKAKKNKLTSDRRKGRRRRKGDENRIRE